MLKKIIVIAAVQFLIFLRPQEYDCLYFCHHFYEAYRNKTMIQKLTCIEGGREALLYCDSCFKEKITKYTTQRNWSKEFFDDVKKNLIRYVVTIGDCDHMIRLR